MQNVAKKSFPTYGAEGDHPVLPGVDGVVVRPVAPHVRGAVDQPGGVERNGVPQQHGQEVAHQEGLAPQVPGHQHGHQKAQDQHGELVVPESNQSINQSIDVTQQI